MTRRLLLAALAVILMAAPASSSTTISGKEISIRKYVNKAGAVPYLDHIQLTRYE